MVKSKSSRQPIVFILSAPSGGGKSSIARRLISEDSNLRQSISVTTRPMRGGEVDGIHYFFKSRPAFEEMIKRGEFLEYSEIYNNLYGISKSYVESLLKQGVDVLFEIDHHGAYLIKETLKNKCVLIFIMPPSMEVLRDRIENRGQNNVDDIDLRMRFAEEEIGHAGNYDYKIVNDDFEDSLRQIQDIIRQERG